MKRLCVIVGAFLVASPIRVTLAEDLTAALSPEELHAVSDAVDRGLQWLSTQQNADGSFNSSEGPSVPATCYTVLGFLSRGHQPDQGRYGRQIRQAIDSILAIQQDDGSMRTHPNQLRPEENWHALAGLTLSEAYGSSTDVAAERIRQAVERALDYSRRLQQLPKQDPVYVGGWDSGDNSQDRWSAVKQTSRELTFMRSAHNAGFEVPQAWIDEGLEFIERCCKTGPFVSNDRHLPVTRTQAVFLYRPKAPPGKTNWANMDTTAAGILALQLHGRRGDPMCRMTADWLVAYPPPEQGTIPRFYHACYQTSQAMAQAGGDYWSRYYPQVVRRLLPRQDRAGYWRIDRSLPWARAAEKALGPAFNTGLAVLCLTLPDQLLPIHQQ